MAFTKRVENYFKTHIIRFENEFVAAKFLRAVAPRHASTGKRDPTAERLQYCWWQ